MESTSLNWRARADSAPRTTIYFLSEATQSFRDDGFILWAELELQALEICLLVLVVRTY